MIFLKILNMGIAASWLITAVFVLRQLMKRAPKWLPCLLWALVAVRLICPFSLESALSLIPDAEPIQLSATSQISVSLAGKELLSYDKIPVSNVPVSTMSKNNLFDTLTHLGSLVWILGIAVLVCYAFVSSMRLHHKMQEAVPLQDRVWICDAVRSPFILGFIRPRIYLPSDMDAAQMKYVLAHEEAHLRCFDHWWKLLAYLLLCIYWFHPLVWIAHGLFCRDLELACDERVIKDMDFAGKKAYSSALLACSLPGRRVMISPLAFGEVGVRERIQTIL
ncbi:MAG: M56 family metallopeptidase, partial [Lachnospiraceae bacterium]|nr:M56 family metallopeptidase [Lachnospiraceae bacterium]